LAHVTSSDDSANRECGWLRAGHLGCSLDAFGPWVAEDRAAIDGEEVDHREGVHQQVGAFDPNGDQRPPESRAPW
jgi:hypothetical protein